MPRDGEVDGCGTGIVILALAAATLLAGVSGATAAQSAGNKGGCAPGNKVRGLACVVTTFTPGSVSGTCDGGIKFGNVRTARTFRLDQAVTASGCLGGADGWTLTSAPGTPLRIR